MIWILYNTLFATVFILLLPKFLLHMRRRGGYWDNFWQQIGKYSPEDRERLAEGGRFWVHGVSVGEVFVALKFMERVRAEQPDVRFVLSTTTSTGNRLAKERIDQRDLVIYFPIDCPFLMRRLLKMIKPRALALIETELWPNLIRRAHQLDVPIYMINGRMSDSSYRGYGKARMFTARILPLFKRIFVQSDVDRERFAALGAPKEKIAVVGTAKYETAFISDDIARKGREILDAIGCGPNRTILLGASTWSGEEELLLDIYERQRKEHPGLYLILAPRHAERRAEVMAAVQARGLTAVARQAMRTEAQRGDHAGDVFLLDTTGELSCFYQHAQIVFVGKSLGAHGGQNPIEPAACGKVVVVGPNMENFRIVMDDLRAGQAIVQVRDAEQLHESIASLLSNPQQCADYGQHAMAVVESKRGAIRRTVEMMNLMKIRRSGSSR